MKQETSADVGEKGVEEELSARCKKNSFFFKLDGLKAKKSAPVSHPFNMDHVASQQANTPMINLLAV